VLTITGTAFLLPAYATASLTLVITPNPAPLNANIVFSGVLPSSFIPVPPGIEIKVEVFKGAGCAAGGAASLLGATAEITYTTGHYSWSIPASDIGVGSYSAVAFVSVLTPQPIRAPCESLSIVPALPPPAIKETDWAIADVGITPKHPQAGDPVTLGAVLVALSSTISFPQSAQVACFIGTTLVSGGVVNYPGPAGVLMTVTLPTPWIATPGTHKLTCVVTTIPAGLNPNPTHNIMSTTFTVAPAVQSTTQAESTITQPVADFTISTTPTSQTVLQGQTVSYSVNVTAFNGFNSLVSLSVSGLPSGANGVLSSPSGTPDFTSTLTVTLPGNASTGSYTLTVTGSGAGATHIANLVLTVNAAATTQTSTSLSSTEASSGLMSVLGQDQFLILGAVVLLAAVVIAVALLSRRNPAPTPPTGTGAATGMVYCAKCGTQNPTANSFCAKCGTKL